MLHDQLARDSVIQAQNKYLTVFAQMQHYIRASGIHTGDSMALSIRNIHAEKLARQVAAETGETITHAIASALEERLEKVRGTRVLPNTYEEIMRISRRCSALPDMDDRAPAAILDYNGEGGFEHGR
jgi:antitoxin VapB